MDPGDTPGTRASIDRCEIKGDFAASWAPGVLAVLDFREFGDYAKRD